MELWQQFHVVFKSTVCDKVTHSLNMNLALTILKRCFFSNSLNKVWFEENKYVLKFQNGTPEATISEKHVGRVNTKLARKTSTIKVDFQNGPVHCTDVAWHFCFDKTRHWDTERTKKFWENSLPTLPAPKKI